MNIEEYERMYHLEDTYWWFQGRMRMIRTILEHFIPEPPRPGRVLDVGCGTGLMMQKVAGWRPVGIDLSPLALGFCRQRGLTHMVRGDVIKLPFASDSLDLILALDLMEHVERDDLMVAEFRRILRPGGCLMATVPAHQFLWSDHDIALHHFRRYSWNSFEKLLQGANLRHVKYSYGISFTYPGIVAFRMLQNLFQARKPEGRARAHLIPLPKLANDFMIGLLHTEARMLKHMNLPFGVSLMSLSQKIA